MGHVQHARLAKVVHGQCGNAVQPERDHVHQVFLGQGLAGEVRVQQAQSAQAHLAQAGAGGFFDDGGFPTGGGWDEVAFPEVPDPNAYALEISGESMMPLYRDGDIVIISPNA